MHENSRGFVVVVDDDPELRSLLVDHLSAEGYFVREFSDGLAALKFLNSSDPETDQVELVISDLKMPDLDGLSLLNNLRPKHPELPVILMTAFASVESAVEGLRKGAFDYLTKPFRLKEISHIVERAVLVARLRKQNKILSHAVKKKWSVNEVLGKSQAMQNVFDMVSRVAASSSSVLISGESGTGKEVIAKAIHKQSARSDKPFVAINCSAIPESLLESELFGHVKGAFTGAAVDKAGLFDEADGGTVFLDEIGDMPMSLQAKMLRVLQEREIRPVGSTQSKPVNVRVLAATHKDLRQAIGEGNFREDLYYRLAVIPILIPPLRHRPEDIPLLANYFLHKYSALNDSRVTAITPTGMQKLMALQWPGNVRELENLIERLVVMTPHSVIQEGDIPAANSDGFESFFGQATTHWPTLEALEKRYMQLILDKTGHKKERAAQILGINRRTLYRKEREFGFVSQDSIDNECAEDEQI